VQRKTEENQKILNELSKSLEEKNQGYDDHTSSEKKVSEARQNVLKSQNQEDKIKKGITEDDNRIKDSELESRLVKKEKENVNQMQKTSNDSDVWRQQEYENQIKEAKEQEEKDRQTEEDSRAQTEARKAERESRRKRYSDMDAELSSMVLAPPKSKHSGIAANVTTTGGIGKGRTVSKPKYSGEKYKILSNQYEIDKENAKYAQEEVDYSREVVQDQDEDFAAGNGNYSEETMAKEKEKLSANLKKLEEAKSKAAKSKKKIEEAEKKQNENPVDSHTMDESFDKIRAMKDYRDNFMGDDVDQSTDSLLADFNTQQDAIEKGQTETKRKPEYRKAQLEIRKRKAKEAGTSNLAGITASPMEVEAELKKNRDVISPPGALSAAIPGASVTSADNRAVNAVGDSTVNVLKPQERIQKEQQDAARRKATQSESTESTPNLPKPEKGKSKEEIENQKRMEEEKKEKEEIKKNIEENKQLLSKIEEGIGNLLTPTQNIEKSSKVIADSIG